MPAMRCHLATAIAAPSRQSGPPRLPNPIRALRRAATKPLSDGLTMTDHLLAGASAAAAAVSAMHPMDTLKTVLQKAPAAATATASAGAAAAAPAQQRGALAVLAATLRAGGPAALYRGLAPSLCSQVPGGALKFAAFETLTQFARGVVRRRSEAKDAAVDYTCAALAFVVCSVVLVPGELVKQRLQAGVYPGMGRAVVSTLRADGLPGMYVGYGATLARDVPYTMLEFGLYAQFKRALRSVLGKKKLTTKEELLMGGLAGGCTGFLTTPLDLAKTRLMTQTAAARQYTGIADVLVKVAREEGVQALFKGSSARVVWLIPFTAIYFGVHEASKRVLLSRRTAAAQAKKD